MDNHIPVIDAHVHLWDTDNLAYPWLKDVAAINKNFLLADYQSETEGLNIAKIIFVECTGAMDDAVSQQEVAWVSSLAENDSKIQGIIAHASLEKGEGVAQHLTWLKTKPLVRGVRRLLQDEELDFCLKPAFIEGVNLLKQYDFTFDICIRHYHLPAVRKMVAQCPEVKFVLDHIGKPDIQNREFAVWQQEIKKLADLPNVTCKISGVITEADHSHWTADDVLPYMVHALEVFGTDRVLFGGDWPVLKLAGKYSEWFELVHELLKDYSHLDKSKFLHENADLVYQLPPIPIGQ